MHFGLSKSPLQWPVATVCSDQHTRILNIVFSNDLENILLMALTHRGNIGVILNLLTRNYQPSNRFVLEFCQNLFEAQGQSFDVTQVASFGKKQASR